MRQKPPRVAVPAEAGQSATMFKIMAITRLEDMIVRTGFN
jgi:hypothetical protein